MDDNAKSPDEKARGSTPLAAHECCRCAMAYGGGVVGVVDGVFRDALSPCYCQVSRPCPFRRTMSARCSSIHSASTGSPRQRTAAGRAATPKSKAGSRQPSANGAKVASAFFSGQLDTADNGDSIKKGMVILPVLKTQESSGVTGQVIKPRPEPIVNNNMEWDCLHHRPTLPAPRKREGALHWISGKRCSWQTSSATTGTPYGLRY